MSGMRPVVRRFRTLAEAAAANREYQYAIEPLVRELVEIEICALPTYTLHADGRLEIGEVRYPPGTIEFRQYLLDQLDRARVRYGLAIK